ncbi:RagB/SusD family nutrient uptake outer membrane protein [Flexithrix dorotheae]|uniref:RagB/SusD family nutrient uptake outer membrane protein n=1 Tax=Flexithrix dorotheae TaxID=70993 RepID=UPI00146C81AE|nr:RagB/SusD family nutrient uptake outer membrane protein [Flexithrix dorotheae]
MKYFKYIIIGLSSLGLLFSCQDFLEENPKSLVSLNSYYNTLNEATTALNGVYSQLQPLYTGLGIDLVADMSADVLTKGSGAGGSSALAFDDFTFDASLGIFADLYMNHYELINSANTLIFEVEKRDYSDENLKSTIIGEAKFLRALAYFNLVRVFGDVPFRIEPSLSTTGLDIERSDESVIFDQIISDLESASESLPENSITPGRANKISANALLAKVYLTRNDYSNSLESLEKVIGTRSLFQNYADVFKVNNENNIIESIFEIQYGLRPVNSDIIQYLNSDKLSGHGFIYGVYAADQKIVDAYEESDKRKMNSVWNEGQGVSFNQWFINKYNDALLPNVEATDAGMINYPILRYADVLLMYAEVVNEIKGGPDGTAYDAINQVRNRAGLTNLPQGLGQEAFLEAVLDERWKEFLCEGERWFDLKRLGKLEEVLNPYGFQKGKHELWPIPQAARDVNPNLNQNDGY